MIIIINSDHINKHYYLTFFTEYVIKRFKCHLCDSKTQTYFNLLTHMATLHFKANLKLQYGDREWECGLCKKVYWLIDRLLILLYMQCKPLNGITLGPRRTNFINQKITIRKWASTDVRYEGIIWNLSIWINLSPLTDWYHYMWYH